MYLVFYDSGLVQAGLSPSLKRETKSYHILHQHIYCSTLEPKLNVEYIGFHLETPSLLAFKVLTVN